MFQKRQSTQHNSNRQIVEYKLININDIIDYIDKNRKFIDNTDKIEKLKLDEIEEEEPFEPLNYQQLKELDKLPPNLKLIFDSNKYFRLGVISNVNIPAGSDISFVSSIIALLVPNFTQLNENEQIEYVQVFIRRIHKESRANFIKFGYSKFGWVVKEFVENIKNFKFGKDLMKYISDFFFVNIFVIDYINDKLVYVGENIFTKYKKNLFVLKIKDNKFEPIFKEECKSIRHDDNVIEEILKNRCLVERLDYDFTHENEESNFIVGEEDLSKYVDNITVTHTENKTNKEHSDDMNGFEEIEEKPNDNNVNADELTDISDKHPSNCDSDSDSNNETPDKNDKDAPNVKVNKSNTLAELIEIAEKNRISVTYKKGGKTVKKTRQMLIDEINNK
jgi:hypothetical protein